jgi:predicted metal-binding transcription factor (methanogenesis marker protein 9)
MDGRVPREREKETCFGNRVWYCAARKHMIHVSLLNARDWSEKRGVNRSIFSSSHLRQPLQKNVIFL